MTLHREPIETERPGLGPLAVLPVFLKLQGRRVVLAGDHPGAPWKVTLLAATGAALEVFSPQPDEALREALAAAPNVRWHPRPWTPADLDGAAFGVAAFEQPAESAAFVAAARARGIIVNAVDRPELCDIQFGAIVNRSPLVVGISTDGAAPTLGQAVRSSIEALLPKGLSAWAETAQGWRERVKQRLGSFAERRRFWERFAARAMAAPAREPSETDYVALIADEDGRGSVALVGAGPGDPELLTLKALRALRTADVILYDALVAPQILDFARREARTMLVGKTGHGPSCRQEEVNELMVKLAREGRRVVRLKGGDPLIFGRANEELEACRAAGIPVEVVPGVTSAQGAAASLSLSLTHRAVARRLQFVTGHDQHGRLPDDLDAGALADPGATTVVYMPRATLPALLARVAAAGLPPDTPALAILEATRKTERTILATVGTLAAAVTAEREGPMLVIYGEAVRAVSLASSTGEEISSRADARHSPRTEPRHKDRAPASRAGR
jgi:uroporphyrin-III C-methyltransferase / precorrin-2 dehydrogenase / sirohydrochlorin ferrochelatase